jgi:hypothetical protein
VGGRRLNGDNAGFQMYALDAPQSLRTIKARLEKIKDERISELALAQDWPDHKRRVGVIEGINEALRVCEELEQAERA